MALINFVRDSITTYDGETFVAFVDISGFQTYMANNVSYNVLNDFYNIGVQVVNEHNSLANNSDKFYISGLLVSDCAILFSRLEESWKSGFKDILSVVEKYNKRMLDRNHLLTTSIAFGEFHYENRTEYPEIRKNPMYGIGYVRAFSDNEYVVPKLQPGECRIVKQGFPPFNVYGTNTIFNSINSEESFLQNFDKLVKTKDGKHYNFYWMVNSKGEIENIKKIYRRNKQEMYENLKLNLKNSIRA